MFLRRGYARRLIRRTTSTSPPTATVTPNATANPAHGRSSNAFPPRRPRKNEGAARRGVAARAVPRFGDEGEQPGRDVRPALLASAKTPRGQPGESLFDVLQFPAGRDRLAQQRLCLLRARLVTRVVRNVRSGVVGQGQLGELFQPGLPPSLQQRPPARAVTSLERGACYRASFCGLHALLDLAGLPAR